MKRAYLFICILAILSLMPMPLLAQDKVEVTDVSAEKTQDEDYMGYVRYQVEADVRNHTDQALEVAVTVRGISDRGGGGTAYLYGRLPAKSTKILSFNGRMLQEDWRALQDWEVVDVSVHDE